jgi:ankyrin repeat protein
MRKQRGGNINENLLKMAEVGDEGSVKTLLRMGADPNKMYIGDSTVCTPLHIAAYNGHLKVVKALMEAGADIKAEGKISGLVLTPIEAANYNHHDNVMWEIFDKFFDPILDEVNVDAYKVLIRSRGEYPLHVAVRLGHEKAIRALLKKNPSIINEKVSKSGDTALHMAALYNNTIIAQLLLEKKADPNTVNKNMMGEGRKTPLHIATENYNLAIVDKLIKHGADVNRTDSMGKTPLYNSLINYRPKKNTRINPIFNKLVEAGADINIGTLVYDMADDGNLDAVNTLIAKGANLNIPGPYYVMPLYAAARRNYVPIVEALLKAGADVKEVMEYQNARPEVLELIVQIVTNMRLSRSKRKMSRSSSSHDNEMKDLESLFGNLSTKRSPSPTLTKRRKIKQIRS